MNLNEKETSIIVAALIAQMQRMRDFISHDNPSESLCQAIQTDIQCIQQVLDKILK